MNIKPSTFRLAVGLYAFTFLIGCKSIQEKHGYTRYSDDKNHFSIAFPSDWQVKQNKNGIAISGIIPTDDNRAAKEGIIIVTRKVPTGSGKIPLDEFYNTSLEFLKGTFRDFTLVESKNVSVDGVEARMFTARYKFGRHQLQGVFYVFVSNNIGYAISGSASHENFSKNEKIFTQIIKTFRFESFTQ